MYEIAVGRMKPLVCSLLIFLCTAHVVYSADTPVLTLEEAMQAAFDYSGERKIQLLRQMNSKYQVDEAKAGMLPVLDLQVTASYMVNPPEGFSFPKGAMGYEPNQYSQAPVPFPEADYPMMEDPENTYFTIETGLRQPVFTWGKLRTGFELSRQNYQLSSLQTEETEVELAKRIRQTYCGLVFGREAVEKLEEIQILLDRILSDREKEFREEIINVETVLMAQKNVSALRTILAEVREGYVKSAEAFSLLTGLNAERYTFENILDSEVKQITNPDFVIRHAFTHSSDIKRITAEEELAVLNKKLVDRTGILRPDFFLNIGLDISGEQVPVVQSNWLETWDINLTVTLGTKITLWDSGLSAAKRMQAAVSQQIAAEGVRQTISNTEMTVRGLLQAHNTAYYRVREYEANGRLLEEQLKNAEVSFENDLITRTERLGAEAVLLQNEVEYLSALLSFQNVRAELAAAAGFDPSAINFGSIQ
jgi:outer membrane protein